MAIVVTLNQCVLAEVDRAGVAEVEVVVMVVATNAIIKTTVRYRESISLQ